MTKAKEGVESYNPAVLIPEQILFFSRVMLVI
jgi:hypothetical protein